MSKLDISIGLVVMSIFCTGCSHTPSVSALCERDKKGNYLLKWEIFPDTDNVPVEIFMSDNDSIFPSTPIKVANSEDYITMVCDTLNAQQRRFFRLKVGGGYSGVVSNRLFELDSVLNFRDIGGYYTNDNRQVKWGRLYRAGTLKYMSSRDHSLLTKLNIKTILDIQPKDIVDSEIHQEDIYLQYVRIPITSAGYRSVSQEIIDGRFMRGDAVIYAQDIYKDMVDNYTEEYSNLFEHLLDENNYPLVINCSLGKDQSGLATYLLLRALDISSEIAEDDYMKSSEGIDRSKLVGEVDSLSESMQEALTMLTRTDMAILRYGISCMKNKSGSVDQYMTKELGLTPDKRHKLRDILLY